MALFVPSATLDEKSYDSDVTFKLAKELSLSVLSAYYAGSETDGAKRQSIDDVIQALSRILKLPSRNSVIVLIMSFMSLLHAPW